jgi:lipid II isoglutaminyl synthase (glutamine-hydrolysing)
MKTVNIVHIYPREMNIYGDNGNVLVLKKRLEWRHIPVDIRQIGVGESLPVDTHLIIGGGGQDAGQSKIAKDLQQKAKIIRQMQNDNVPMLMICGMYQMFGHYFKTTSGEIIPGIGVLDIRTVAGQGRLIGNVNANTQWGQLTGYENHSGLTTLGDQVKAIGHVPKNQGNNGADNTEGAYQNNIFGSYLHGPLLAKSPKFADYLIKLALQVAGCDQSLTPLDDDLEQLAASVAYNRGR